jgi:hypothetical protein
VKKAPTSRHTNQLAKDYTCCKSKYKEKEVEDKWKKRIKKSKER